jgi:hypothetical protein
MQITSLFDCECAILPATLTIAKNAVPVVRWISRTMKFAATYINAINNPTVYTQIYHSCGFEKEDANDAKHFF